MTKPQLSVIQTALDGMLNSPLQLNEEGKPVVTSLMIAERFERRHDNVLRTIQSLIEDGTIDLLSTEEIEYIDARGRKQPAFAIGEREAFIIMPFIGGRKSRDGQRMLVDAFLGLRDKAIKLEGHVAWLQEQLADVKRSVARNFGKHARRALTDSIQELQESIYANTGVLEPGIYAYVTWIMYAWMFEYEGRIDTGLRDRLEYRQVTALDMAEWRAADMIPESLPTGVHWRVAVRAALEPIRLRAIEDGRIKLLPCQVKATPEGVQKLMKSLIPKAPKQPVKQEVKSAQGDLF